MAEYVSGSMAGAISTSDKYDFKTMIANLRKIEEIPARKMLKWKADWEKRVDGFKELKKSLTTLKDGLAKMSSIDSFMVKTATSSNSAVASVTAKSTAQTGDYTLVVNKLARNAMTSYSSPGLANKDSIINNTGQNQTFEYSYVGKDGTSSTRDLVVASGTTLGALVNMINGDGRNSDVTAMIVTDGAQASLQLRGKLLGAAHTIAITSNTTVSNFSGINFADGQRSSTVATGSSLSFSSGLFNNNLNTVINDSGAPQDLKFTVGGTQYTAIVPIGGKVSDLITSINNSGAGVSASFANNTLKITSNTLGAASPVMTFASSDIHTVAPGSIDLSSGWTAASGIDSTLNYSVAGITTGNELVNDSGANQTFEYTVGGVVQSVSVPSGTSFNALVASLSGSLPGGVSFSSSIVGGVGTISFNAGGQALTHSAGNSVGVEGAIAMKPVGANWSNEIPQDAEYRVNNWPAPPAFLKSESNTLETAIEGLTVNLRSAGTTYIAVSANTADIKKNVESFMELYNTYKTSYTALTKVDNTKDTVSPDYTDSLFDSQKGGVLTGNYVVQMIGQEVSNVISSSGKGFVTAVNTDSSVFWDAFANLSSLGIVTDSREESSTFGLLIYKDPMPSDGSLSALDQALKDDPMAVASLFGAKNVGASNNNNFSYLNSLDKLTRPGEYSVKYDVVGGKVVNATINGVAASVESDGKTLVANGDSDARGLTLVVNNLADGSYQAPGASVFIKQGKVNEMLETVSRNDTVANPLDPASPISFKGSIQRLDDLIAQYVGKDGGDGASQGIIKNITAKIAREDERLIKWERTITAKFSRLEATLARYDEIQKQLESQVKQLSTSSSS